jgi:hypothetical protein
MNFLIILSAALVPLIMGFIYYNPKTLGNKWMEAAGLTEEKMKNANMAVVFGVTFLLSLILAVFMQLIVIHQVHVQSLLSHQADFKNTNSESSLILKKINELYSTSYRTFKHGVLHGVIAGFMFAMPILTINALFERKGFKYIAINAGYWILTLGLMGGIICGFLKM